MLSMCHEYAARLFFIVDDKLVLPINAFNEDRFSQCIACQYIVLNFYKRVQIPYEQ